MARKFTVFLVLLVFAVLVAACGAAGVSIPMLGQQEVLKDLGSGQCRDCHKIYFDEWDKGKHKVSLVKLKENSNKQNSCLGCMSAEGALAQKKEEITFENALNGVTCLACHLPHGAREGLNLRLPREILCVSCHTAGQIEPGKGVNYPQKEMFLGTGGIGVKEMPSNKSKIGMVCFDCHMPVMGKEPIAALPGNLFDALQPSYKSLVEQKDGQYFSKTLKDRSSHGFEVILNGPDNSCGKCHPQFPVEAFQAIVDGVIADIKVQVDQMEPRLKALENALKALQENKIDPGQSLVLYNEAKVNFDLVKNDGSYGFHNYAYAQALLKVAGEKMQRSIELLP